MCTNGVNTGQLRSTIEMIDATVALTRKWTHKSYHLADDAGMQRSAKQLAAVQAALDEVRAMLEDAQDAVDRDDADNGVQVALV